MRAAGCCKLLRFAARNQRCPAPAMIAKPMAAGLLLLTAAPASAQLDEEPDILVTGLKLDDALSARSGIPIEKVPQSVQVLTPDDLTAVAARSIGDALRLVPSGNTGPPRAVPFQSFAVTIRGFAVDQMRNGVRQRFYEEVDPSALSNIERIEVLKGPSSVLFGQSAVGGLISITTKRPQQRWGAEFSLTGGSFGERRAALDLTGPVVSEGFLSFRATGEIERSDTYFDFVPLDRTNLAFALSSEGSDKLSSHLVVEYQRRDTVGNPGLPPVGTVLPNGIAPIPRHRNYNEPAFARLLLSAPLIQGWTDIKLTERWSLTPRVSYNEFNTEIARTGILNLLPDLRTIRRFAFQSSEHDDAVVAQLDLNGELALGGTGHRLLLGLEWARERTRFRQDVPAAAVPPIDVLAPVYGRLAPPPWPTVFRINSRLESLAAYAQDVVTVSDALQLVLGIRYSTFDTLVRQNGAADESRFSALTWQAGATLKLGGGFSAFGGYNSGFDSEAVVGARSVTGEQFDPQESNQKELGLRYSASGLRFSASLFDLRRTNVLTVDPENPNFRVSAGTQRVRGFEVEGEWKPARDVAVQTGYAHLRGHITRSNNGDEGDRIADAPRHRANLSAQYTPAAFAERLTLRASYSYVGSRPFSNARVPIAPGLLASDVNLPAYDTVHVGTGLRFDRFRVDADLTNIFDRRYFVRNGPPQLVYPGEPRVLNVRLTANW
jgi:iron complex outermembrane recepter protein